MKNIKITLIMTALTVILFSCATESVDTTPNLKEVKSEGAENQNNKNDEEPAESYNGHEDPIPKRPILFMAYSVGLAALLFIIDLLCKWWQALMG